MGRQGNALRRGRGTAAIRTSLQESGRIIQEIDCGLARAATLDVSPQRTVLQAGKGFAEASQDQWEPSLQTSCRRLAEKERTRFGPARKITGVRSASLTDLILLSTHMAPVAEKSQAAPATHKQPSRKGKKAWRKNVDITELQEGVEDVREQIIQGYEIAICVSRAS